MWGLLSHTVRGPRNTFLLAVVHLESFANPKHLRMFENKRSLAGLYIIFGQWCVKDSTRVLNS